MSFKIPLRAWRLCREVQLVGGVVVKSCFGTPLAGAARGATFSAVVQISVSASGGTNNYFFSTSFRPLVVNNWSGVANQKRNHQDGRVWTPVTLRQIRYFSSSKAGQNPATISMSNFFHAAKQNGLSVTEQDLQETCFQYYDKDEDGGLNLKEFGTLCRDLLSDSTGKPYSLQIRMQADMFYVFDQNKDGKVDDEEFKFMWEKWVKAVLFPVTALLIVDVQNDFISGSLAIHKCPAGHMGEEVVPVINNMLDSVNFNETIYTLDWHPEDHISFISNISKRPLHHTFNMTPDEVQVYDTVLFEGPPKIEQKMWPVHCIQGSWGSELHPDLKIVENAVFVHKGTNSEIDSYSAFWDNQKLSETSLNSELKSRGITDVFICGIAYDICVASTARHALENGYRTYLVDDASRGVCSEDISDMIKKLIAQGAILVQSHEVKDLVEAKDRRLEMGYRSAMMLAATLRDNGVKE